MVSAARAEDVATGKTLHVLRDHEDKVTHVVFSPDGKLLATGTKSWQGTVRLWAVRALEPDAAPKGPQ